MFEKTNKQKTPCHECFVWISAIFAACLKGYQSSPRLQLRGDHPQLCLKRGVDVSFCRSARNNVTIVALISGTS